MVKYEMEELLKRKTNKENPKTNYNDKVQIKRKIIHLVRLSMYNFDSLFQSVGRVGRI